MILGALDDVVCNEAAKKAFEAVSTKDKTLKILDQADHSVIQDKEFATSVITESIDWFDARLTKWGTKKI